MHAIYQIRSLNNHLSEIVEISTHVRVYLGTDCAQWAARMGLDVR